MTFTIDNPSSGAQRVGTISTAADLAFTVSIGAPSRWALTSVTDSAGNTVSELGAGHTAKVMASGGTVADGASLAIAATGPAISSTRFTYTAPASGNFTNTITATVLASTSYTNATATASK